MNVILSDYHINQQTVALLPAYTLEYDTIVLEQDQKIHVKKPALHLIKEACLTYGSSYEGRRESVMHQTGVKRKVPIPISIYWNLYAFPTHSPTDYNCAWLFHRHIYSIHPSSDSKTTILFNNNECITVDVSPFTIQNQIKRTELCQLTFSNGETEIPSYNLTI
ncbi:competence protein ComK [Oceanobacillus luteolus]|uniref:Competence protein ComK n=1 Tax=Oceanobacillus luteolus TaxID=1274358 RepID=A0ABW4HVP4_9BACI|nr:competence protein ComK [Oceanobacillus luteolus]MCM3742114.1 competence protein ComK [Oceanobacillus luteolus]